MFFHRRTFLVAIKRKMCHVSMVDFLMIMEKAVCTLGSVTFQGKEIKPNNYQYFCVSDV